VTLCAVCNVHVEMRSAGFLVKPENQGRQFGLKTTVMVCQWFGLKSTGIVFSGLGSKPVAMVFSPFGLKTGGDGFSQFGLRIGGSGFPVWASKPAATFW
jgi:hypothetical protein